MKKVTVLLVTMMLAACSLSAQEVRPAIKAGAKSLNFTFGGFGSFGLGASGVSGGLGMSYFLSSDAALRIGLQAAINSTKTPWNDNTTNGTNPGADGSTSALSLGLGVDYLMYMNAMTPRVKPYWGLGGSIAITSSDSKPAVSNNAENGTTIETKNGNGNEGLTFGVAGILGAEFFLYNELSLSAEYKLNLISITSRADRTVITKGNPDFVTKNGSATQILGFGAAGATLHIYF